MTPLFLFGKYYKQNYETIPENIYIHKYNKLHIKNYVKLKNS